MKKVICTIAIAAIFASCNGKKAEDHVHDHSDGTHQHENGDVHPEHSEEVKQEEFSVAEDTIAKDGGHGHSHDEGSDHKH